MASQHSFYLTSEQATAGLAARLAPALAGGDVLLLEGEIGAGKTHFARALIQSRLARPEDVPSPTFTLVQTYDAGEVEIWHSDLYRLTGPDEAEELGLTEAFETAICLIEWPDRLGPLTPASALTLRFSTPTGAVDHRRIDARWTHPRWTARLQEIAS